MGRCATSRGVGIFHHSVFLSVPLDPMGGSALETACVTAEEDAPATVDTVDKPAALPQVHMPHKSSKDIP